MSTIVVGNSSFYAYAVPAGLRDTAIWRLPVVDTPPLYYPIIEQSAAMNKAKTNVNSTIIVEVPIAVKNPTTGLWSSSNKVRATATFTSLQNVSEATAHGLAIDALIAALTARKDAMLAGKTQD